MKTARSTLRPKFMTEFTFRPPPMPRASESSPTESLFIQNELKKISDHLNLIENSLRMIFDFVLEDPRGGDHCREAQSLFNFSQSIQLISRNFMNLILEIWNFVLQPKTSVSTEKSRSGRTALPQESLTPTEPRTKVPKSFFFAQSEQKIVRKSPLLSAVQKSSLKPSETEQFGDSHPFSEKMLNQKYIKEKTLEVQTSINLLGYVRQLSDEMKITKSQRSMLKKMIIDKKIGKEDLKDLTPDKVKTLMLERVSNFEQGSSSPNLGLSLKEEREIEIS